MCHEHLYLVRVQNRYDSARGRAFDPSSCSGVGGWRWHCGTFGSMGVSCWVRVWKPACTRGVDGRVEPCYRSSKWISERDLERTTEEWRCEQAGLAPRVVLFVLVVLIVLVPVPHPCRTRAGTRACIWESGSWGLDGSTGNGWRRLEPVDGLARASCCWVCLSAVCPLSVCLSVMRSERLERTNGPQRLPTPSNARLSRV